MASIWNGRAAVEKDVINRVAAQPIESKPGAFGVFTAFLFHRSSAAF